MKRERGRVYIDLTETEFEMLILLMGQGAGNAMRANDDLRPWLRLANAINKGNPNWRPYEVSE